MKKCRKDFFNQLFLRQSLSLLGTRNQRERQRTFEGLFSEENRFYYNFRGRARFCRIRAQLQTEKTAWLEDPIRSYECCISELNSVNVVLTFLSFRAIFLGKVESYAEPSIRTLSANKILLLMIPLLVAFFILIFFISLSKTSFGV